MSHAFHRRDINAQQARSPRQIAKKAYNTASKKISLDNRRKRQQYHMRERLLIQNTMVKAELMLNNQPSEASNCKVVLSDPFDNIKTPLCHGQVRYYPPPPPLSISEPVASLSAPSHVMEPSEEIASVNTTIQKSSIVTVMPFQFLQNIFNYLRLPFFDSWRLPRFISWSAFFFTRRDRGSCLHTSARISIAANFTQK